MSGSSVFSRVVEWSPVGVTGYDAATRQLRSTDSLAALSSQIGAGPVLLTVSRRATFLKAVRVPNAGASEINLILQTQMATMFPVPLSELAFSFRLTDDVNAEGRLAIVAAMREADLRAVLTEAKEAGFRVERVVPAAFGSMLLAESLGQQDAAVIQKTGEGLAIDLLIGGELRYSRVAPMPRGPEAIDSEIGRSFAAVGLPCAPTIAAGGIDYADAETLSAVPTIEALATMPIDKIGINLETRDVLEKRSRAAQNNRNRIAVLFVAGALIASLAVYFERSDADGQVAHTQAIWNSRNNKLRKDKKDAEAKAEAASKLSAAIDRAFSPAQKASDIVTVLSNHVPKNLWLTGITFERGKTMFVRGTATESGVVYAYMQALTSEPRLRDVKLVFANNGEIDKTPVVQFSIQLFPIGNLPLMEATKKGATKK